MTNLTNQIKARARELGFDKVGIASAETISSGDHLLSWLSHDYPGEMQWMRKSPEKRSDPREILPGAKSIISVALNYYTRKKPSEDPTQARISRYAWGKDYHEMMEQNLRSLYEFIIQEDQTAQGRFYVDTGPVLERALAQRAGLGGIGKHTNLITKEYGSWVFLGEIILNVELEYDEPETEDFCGQCTLCLDACPTQAFVAPYVLDARRCISYLTIEHRSNISDDLKPALENMIFGCDICQEVCPWNRYGAVPAKQDVFQPDVGNRNPSLKPLLAMSLEEFRSRFRHSPIKRTKWRGFLRNVALALGNSRDRSALPALVDALSHEEPLVRSSAAWALGRLNVIDSTEPLARALEKEEDTGTRQHMENALNLLSSRRTPET